VTSDFCALSGQPIKKGYVCKKIDKKLRDFAFDIIDGKYIIPQDKSTNRRWVAFYKEIIRGGYYIRYFSDQLSKYQPTFNIDKLNILFSKVENLKIVTNNFIQKYFSIVKNNEMKTNE
jgi:hypothetical protein